MGGIITGAIGAVTGFFKGGVVGIIASLIQRFLDGKEKKADHDKEIRLAEIALESVRSKGDADAIIAAIEANAKAQTASYDHDTKTLGLHSSLDAFFSNSGGERGFWGYFLFAIAFLLEVYRGSVRPNMCYIFTGLSMWIVYYGIKKYGVSQEVMQKCVEYSVYSCVELTGAIIGWYFGLRQRDKDSIKR